MCIVSVTLIFMYFRAISVLQSNTVPSPVPHTYLRACPPPSPVFTGRQEVLDTMHNYFNENVGGRHVYVLHGLGGSGKSQIGYKFVELSQAGAKSR